MSTQRRDENAHQEIYDTGISLRRQVMVSLSPKFDQIHESS